MFRMSSTPVVHLPCTAVYCLSMMARRQVQAARDVVGTAPVAVVASLVWQQTACFHRELVTGTSCDYSIVISHDHSIAVCAVVTAWWCDRHALRLPFWCCRQLELLLV